MTDRSRFAEAADRLDRFVAEIKVCQYDATGAGPLPSTPAPAPHGRDPDQDWQRDFSARTIVGRGESAPPQTPHKVVHASGPPRPPEAFTEKPRVPASSRSHIGAILGKPAKKRGVLARLFRGSDR